MQVRHHQDRLAAATAGHSADQRTHDEQLLIARNDTKRLEEKLDKAETEIRRLQADATDHIREAARQEQNALHALTDQKAVTSRAKEDAEMVQFKLTAAEEQLAELKAKLAAVEEGRKGDMASGKEQRDALRAKLADKEAELSLQVRRFLLLITSPSQLPSCLLSSVTMTLTCKLTSPDPSVLHRSARRGWRRTMPRRIARSLRVESPSWRRRFESNGRRLKNRRQSTKG